MQAGLYQPWCSCQGATTASTQSTFVGAEYLDQTMVQGCFEAQG